MIASGKLPRGLLLRALYSVRSECVLMEQLRYNLLFGCFVSLNMGILFGNTSVFCYGIPYFFAGCGSDFGIHP